MAPLFSIITVTYNAAEVIDRTLRSVASQECRLFELIVQDGGSTDSTVERARAICPDAVIVSEPDGGIYDAMNRAMARATGDYLIFLNAGDAFHSPSTLADVADAVMREDYPGVVYGLTDIVDADGARIGSRHLQPPGQLTPRSFRHGMLVCHQAFIVLRKIAPAYDTRYRLSADFDWCIRALEASRRNYYLQEVLIDYLNEGMTTRNHRASLWERYRIMCRHYGTLSSTLRHIGFLFRAIRRHLK